MELVLTTSALVASCPLMAPGALIALFWSSESSSIWRNSWGLARPRGSKPRSPGRVPSSHGVSLAGSMSGSHVGRPSYFLGGWGRRGKGGGGSNVSRRARPGDTSAQALPAIEPRRFRRDAEALDRAAENREGSVPAGRRRSRRAPGRQPARSGRARGPAASPPPPAAGARPPRKYEGRPTWLPDIDPAKETPWLDGTLPGDRGFDPLGLAKPQEFLQMELDSLDQNKAINAPGAIKGQLAT